MGVLKKLRWNLKCLVSSTHAKLESLLLDLHVSHLENKTFNLPQIGLF